MIEPSHSLHTDEPRVIGTMMGDGIASDVSDIKKNFDFLVIENLTCIYTLSDIALFCKLLFEGIVF